MTADELHELFEYKDGVLYWKVDRRSKKVAGKPAGSVNTKGYRIVWVNGKRRLNHRVIYTMFHGSCPDMLDHINGIKTDNRIENLRPADIFENSQNAKLRVDNKSGARGVFWCNTNSMWRVYVRCRNVVHKIGYFKDLNEAVARANEARERLHGAFCRLA